MRRPPADAAPKLGRAAMISASDEGGRASPLPSSLEEPVIEGLDLDGVAREHPDTMPDHQLGESLSIDQHNMEA